MVELRWSVGREPHYEDGVCIGHGPYEKVLQYRQKVETSVAGELFDVVWSEWIDVPTVREPLFVYGAAGGGGGVAVGSPAGICFYNQASVWSCRRSTVGGFMLEMRWLEKHVASGEMDLKAPVTPYKTVKVLQYRKAMKVQHKDAQGQYVLCEEWSEWIDVPTVEEDK